MRTTFILAAMALSAFGLAGCHEGGEAGSYNHVTGNMTGTLNASLSRSHDATISAARDMGFRVSKDNMDAMQSMVEVKDATDHTIGVHLKKLTDRTTSVTIDQSMLTGNESEARNFFDKIKSHLSPM